MSYRDYRIGFSGTDLISPTQFEYYPELKYRMPQALAHALYRLEEVQGEINDMELSEEVRRIARKRRHILNGWIAYYREQLKHVNSGESLVADDSSLRTNARRTQGQTIP